MHIRKLLNYCINRKYLFIALKYLKIEIFFSISSIFKQNSNHGLFVLHGMETKNNKIHNDAP